MADQSISQLGTATALTGNELTVVVQNGVTKQTQLQSIANLGGPAGPVGPQGPTGPAGPGATIQVNSTVTGAPGTNASVTNVGSLTTAMFNFVIPRGDVGATGATGATGPAGPGVAAGGTTNQYLRKVDGTNYNTNWADLPTYVSSVSGTANQINVATGTTTAVLSFANNAVFPGTAAVQVPAGNTAQRAGVSPVNGLFRYNSQTGLFEGYSSGSWTAFALGSGVTSIATGTGLTGGPITSTGTIDIANTGVTAGSYTNANITINAQGQITLAANGAAGGVTTFSAGTTGLTPNTASTGAITLAGTLNVANGGTGANTLTGYLVGNGTSAITAVSTIPNAGLTNSSITLGSSNVSLGGTLLAPAGLTSVTVTQDPTLALQLTTKQYVDGLVSTGLAYHLPVQATTTQSLAAQTGGTVTYNAPGPEGVGATITLSVALTTLDGYTLVNTNRILVKNEVNQAYNGIYTWATGGTVLTRSTDTNTYGPGVNQLSQNDYFFTQNGTVNKGTSYVVTTVGTINFTTTPITFSEFSSSLVYTGGTGITVTGTVISLSNTAVTTGTYGNAARTITQTVNQQGQITNIFDQPISIPASAINTTIPNSGLTNSAITINGASVSLGGSISVGTVTSVSGTGTVNGLTLSGTVTSTGSLTLGGTLNLSNPPAIGGTTPAAITGTTITATTYVGISGGTY